MNHGGKFKLCLIGGMALGFIVRADDTVAPGDPYATVIERNIFGLNPPPPPNANPQDANPPPKITPNGTMDILGELQVLFKVAQPPRPGSPPTPDESYILSEGQRQDDIEVVKIDQKNSIVTFNNHGETQTLPLVTTMPASTPAPAPAAPGGPGGRFSPGFVNPGGRPGGQPRSGGVGYGGAGVNGNGGGNGANNIGGAGSGSIPDNSGHATLQNPLAGQFPPGLTPEIQTIAIEANRIATQSQVDSGELPPLPPTELTPPDATGIGGVPLIPPDPDPPK
jgi:hypothetical protein